MAEEPCNTGLALRLWWEVTDVVAASPDRKRRREPIQFHVLFPPCSKEEEVEGEELARSAGEEERWSCGSMPRAAAEVGDAQERKPRRAGGADKRGGSRRKKLRLTKEQSSLLEDSFREHNTLTPAQKQELAARLNLRARQVEVWFQNRRARTKLKQTEEDCEFLKKLCESQRDENWRLEKELKELRSFRHGCMPFHHHLHLSKAAVAAPAVCPCCERIAAGAAGGGKGTGSGGNMAPAGRSSWFYDRASIKDSSMTY